MVGAWLLTISFPKSYCVGKHAWLLVWLVNEGVSKLTQTILRIGQDGLQTVVLGNGPKQD